MDREELKRDWLTSNALLAFVGALLMGQVWQMSEGTVKIFFIFTVSDYSGLVILVIIAVLFVLSVFLALGALFFQPVGRYVFRSRTTFSFLLEFLVWVSFTLSWAAALSELPLDQWWSLVLLLGGVSYSFVFIPLRALQSRFHQRRSRPDGRSDAQRLKQWLTERVGRRRSR